MELGKNNKLNKLMLNRMKDYETKSDLINKGLYRPIPFTALPSLTNSIPGIIPGIMYKITSHTGMGKTQLSKYLFVTNPILYAIRHNINFKILYFAAEETKQEFIDGLIVFTLNVKYKCNTIDRFKLTGDKGISLTKQELELIRLASVDVSKILNYLTIVDDYCHTTDQIYKKCREFAEFHGTFSTDIKGNEIYTKKDPNQIVLIVYDHVSLIRGAYDAVAKRMPSDFEAIGKWSTDICKRILTKRWNWAVLNVQQQSLESEKQVFTSKGDSIINKILPSIDGLANNREIARDDYVIIGIFAPVRYEFEDFRGYKIYGNGPEYFNDNFRSIHVLKNRFGRFVKPISVYFDGGINYFKELPRPSDSAALKLFNKKQ